MVAVKRAMTAFLAVVLAVGCSPTFPRTQAFADEGAAPYVAAQVAPAQLQATDDYDISWYTGKESPYTITGVKQLKGFAHLVNEGTDTFEGKTVQLPGSVTSAIAFVGTSIESIGTPDHPFNGTFDGQETPIANLTLDIGDRLSNIGLFGYVGNNATIKNMRLTGGSVEVTNTADGKTISNVGAIAGHLGGSLENCYSSVAVTVTNNGKVPEHSSAGSTAEELCASLNIGGLVGDLGGDLLSCVHAGGAVAVNSTSDVSDYVPYIVGFVGGLAGHQGDESDAAHVTHTTDCHNRGPITFNISGSGGLDRFGSRIYSQSTMVGGIVGYSMGGFADCTNEAEIQTGVVKDGAIQAGWGASTTGGIVGSMRGPTVAISASSTGVVGSSSTDPGYSVWTASNGTAEPETLVITRCSNTADVTGLASNGGIVGSTGAFTKVVGCSNAGKIEGTRWNKPCPGGIVGISNGDVAYCYNRGRCVSTTGGGYYASGIAALLTTYNISSTPDNLRLQAAEIYGCYVTGTIGGSEEGYRTAVLAGENDGYIHDNCFLPDLTVDKATGEDGFIDGKMHSRLVSKGENRGTLANNYELSADAMKTSLAVSYLNKPQAKKSDWTLYYATVENAFPILSWQVEGISRTTQLSKVATGVGQVTDPEYSASTAPVPAVAIVTTGGVELYQDADYKVVVSESAKAVGQTYTADIVGINGYSGTLSAKVSYVIQKADIASCTVSCESLVFNWEQQRPTKSIVTVRDDAGMIVDPNEYDVSDNADPDKGTKAVKGRYYDYVNCHDVGYRYDVVVTARDDSEHFKGSTTQAVMRIKWASLGYNPKSVPGSGAEESAKLGDVVWGGQTWDIAKALDTKGYVKIKYTGGEITPTFASVTYLGRDMRDGTGKPYYEIPLDYDYRYLYGNPNPEDGKDLSSACVDVTGSKETDLVSMTVRFTTGGNFDNYTNVFFEIVPADIASDVKVSGIAKSVAFTAGGAKVSPKLTYNGMTLKKGTDYTLSYKNNKKAGTASVTIKGKGNYSGKVTKQFKVTKAMQPMKVTAANKTVSASKVAGAAQTMSAVSIKKAQGAVTCRNVSSGAAARFAVDAKGRITLPKGTPAGTYNVKVKVTAKGTAAYKLGAKTATARITVK